MKKIISLVKACMTDNMNLYRIKSKNQSEISKKVLPVVITLLLLFSIWSYANMIMEPLVEAHCEIVLLTLFILFSVFLTIIEGIYKSGSLLFNCKDDQLLLALPLKRATVLFIRIFKFYVFELMYNALLILPAMFVYVRYINVTWTFYLTSFIALLVIPIVPIIVSCIIGGLTTMFSSKFKYKNAVQIVITTIFLLGVLYVSFNLQNIVADLAQQATSLNDIITRLYYPAGAYINLVTNFNAIDLLIYILVHILLFAALVFVLGKVYFKINSKAKIIKANSKSNGSKEYTVKANKPIVSIIKKELNRFATSPVFVINAGFGLVLFVIGCILICTKFDSLPELVKGAELEISVEQIKQYVPVISFGLVCFASFMSSITCSMISLEGRNFNILKSLPIKPFTIIISKVATAVLIMIPFMLIGDIIMFAKFGFNILEMAIILVSSIIFPITAETMGIIINLKYPKMDAETDTEVVKQSMSTMIATFSGMILTGLSIAGLVSAAMSGFNTDLIIGTGLIIGIVICALLLLYLSKRGEKEFKKIII